MALLRDKGPDSVAVQGFFQLHGVDQAAAMCILIATSAGSDKLLPEKAIRALFLYCCDPVVIFPQQEGLWTAQTSQLPGNLSSIYPDGAASLQQRSAFMQKQPAAARTYEGYDKFMQTVPWQTSLTSSLLQVQQPQQQQQLEYSMGPEIKYSSRHNGLYIHFSRIMSPLWRSKLLTEKTSPAYDSTSPTLPQLLSLFNDEALSFFIDQLRRLKDLIDKNNLINYRFQVPG